MKTAEDRDLLVMKLLHYFVTERDYNPVVVHGIQNEIWLENMDSEYRIVRIVLGYIHNKEQLDFDNFKVSRMVRQIKLKTFTLKMKVLSIYIDLNEDLEIMENKHNHMIKLNDEEDLKNNVYIKQSFSDMPSKLKFTDEGSKLYEKINTEILKKNIDTSNKINNLFTPKKPIITYMLIGLMTFVFMLMYIFGKGSEDISTLYVFGALVKDGNPIRIFTNIFLHIGIIHLFMNMYSLAILGRQTESFYGHIKMLTIFIYSGIIGSLLSVILMDSSVISAGASGAIFGLMGALLYFAINQRTYMAEALKKQILPVLILNLIFTFTLPSINMYAHIGGLIGGLLASNALGIKYKTSNFERTNGIICSVILLGVLTYIAYFM